MISLTFIILVSHMLLLCRAGGCLKTSCSLECRNIFSHPGFAFFRCCLFILKRLGPLMFFFWEETRAGMFGKRQLPKVVEQCSTEPAFREQAARCS